MINVYCDCSDDSKIKIRVDRERKELIIKCLKCDHAKLITMNDA